MKEVLAGEMLNLKNDSQSQIASEDFRIITGLENLYNGKEINQDLQAIPSHFNHDSDNIGTCGNVDVQRTQAGTSRSPIEFPSPCAPCEVDYYE